MSAALTLREMDLVASPVPSATHGHASAENDFHVAVEDWIKRGEQIPLRDVPYEICSVISHHFPPKHETWKELASELYGKRKLTQFDLELIEGDAFVVQQWPSLVLLLYCSTELNLSFSDVLTVLYKKLKRLDCLQRLYKCVTEFLEYRERQTTKLSSAGSLLQPPTPMDDALSELMQKTNNEKLKSALGYLKLRGKQEHNFDLNGLAAKSSTKDILQIVNACKVSYNIDIKENKNDGDKPTPQQKLLPNMLNKSESHIQSSSPILQSRQCIDLSRRVVVLMTYSADVNTNVPSLVQRFWDANIGVVSEWVLRGKGYFETNPRDAWENFFAQCNFVVPVISSGYLKDIQHPSDNEQARWVRYVYDLYTRKYVTDGCLNNMVRPIVMDDITSRHLKKVNPTLSMGWRLEELDNFIGMLKNYAR